MIVVGRGSRVNQKVAHSAHPSSCQLLPGGNEETCAASSSDLPSSWKTQFVFMGLQFLSVWEPIQMFFKTLTPNHRTKQSSSAQISPGCPRSKITHSKHFIQLARNATPSASSTHKTLPFLNWRVCTRSHKLSSFIHSVDTQRAPARLWERRVNPTLVTFNICIICIAHKNI